MNTYNWKLKTEAEKLEDFKKLEVGDIVKDIKGTTRGSWLTEFKIFEKREDFKYNEYLAFTQTEDKSVTFIYSIWVVYDYSGNECVEISINRDVNKNDYDPELFN